VVIEGFAHLLLSIRARQEGGHENDLRFLSGLTLEVATDEIVEQLVVTSEFDVGLYGHGVVALEDGILELGEADGNTLFVAFGKVVTFEHPGNVHLAVQTEQIGAGEFGEPFPVAAHLGFFWIDDLEDLVGVGFGVLLDDFGFKGGTGFGPTCGVANPGGVVAYDDDGEVPGFLELADFGQHEGVTEMQVGSGGVEAKFDAERPTRGEFLGELLSGVNVG